MKNKKTKSDWRETFAGLSDGLLPSKAIPSAGKTPTLVLSETASAGRLGSFNRQDQTAATMDAGPMTQHQRNLSLLAAAANSDNNGIVSWLESGADPDCQSRSRPGDSALTICAKLANSDGVRALLTRGANHSISNRSGETALLIAMDRGFFNVSSTILAIMSDGLTDDESNSFFDEALVMACRLQDFKTAKLLMPDETKRTLNPDIALMFVNCFCGSGPRRKNIPDRVLCLDLVLERQPNSSNRAATIDSAFDSATDLDDGELFKKLLFHGFAPSYGWSDERGTPIAWVGATRNHGRSIFASMMTMPALVASFKSHTPDPWAMKGLSREAILNLQSMGGRVDEARGPCGENIVHVLLAKDPRSFVDLKNDLADTVRTWPSLARTTDSNGKSPFDHMRSSLLHLQETHRPSAVAVVDFLERLSIRLEAGTLLAFSKKVERKAAKLGMKKQENQSPTASI